MVETYDQDRDFVQYVLLFVSCGTESVLEDRCPVYVLFFAVN